MVQGVNSVEARIARRFDGLSPQLRRAASYVLAHPDEVATHSLRQVSRAAKIAPPTLSRLARALDCESYEAFREICVTCHQRLGGGPLEWEAFFVKPDLEIEK